MSIWKVECFVMILQQQETLSSSLAAYLCFNLLEKPGNLLG